MFASVNIRLDDNYCAGMHVGKASLGFAIGLEREQCFL